MKRLAKLRWLALGLVGGVALGYSCGKSVQRTADEKALRVIDSLSAPPPVWRDVEEVPDVPWVLWST